MKQSVDNKTLGAVCREIYRYPTYFGITYVEEGIPEVRGELILEDGTLETDRNQWRFINKETATRFPRTLLETDDLVMSVRGTIGKVGLVPKSLQGANITANLIRISPYEEVIEPKYLWHFMRTEYFRTPLNHVSSSTTIKTIRVPDLKAIPIPLPPLEEQRRIVAILDRADAIRRKRQEAIRLTEELLRSTFLEMFGNIQSHRWELCKVEDIIAKHPGSIRTGPFGSQLLHGEFVDEGIAVLGIDNAVQNQFQWAKLRFITKEKYAELKRYTVQPDDVIITIMGTCGRCAIVPHDCPIAINTKHLCCITLDKNKCLSEFLHSYFLIHPEAQKYLKMNAKGAIMEGLNMTIIKNLPVPLVPIHLQEKYQRIHQKQYELKNKIISTQNKDDSLFNSLLQKAFCGEL